MADGSGISVLRRKAGEGRAQEVSGRMTPARVLRAAFIQGAEEEAGLVATVSKVDEARLHLPAFLEALPENPLLALCEGPEERLALVVFDADSLAALLEMQTTGRVVARPAPKRSPTRTDALLAGGLIDRVLRLFEEGAAEADLDIAPLVAGYRYSLPLAELRAIEMTLPDIPYLLFTLQVDYAEGAKQGRVQILLPRVVQAPGAGKDSAAWQEKLRDVVQCAEAEMEAVLARKEMLLRDVAALTPGALITLPREVVDQVHLIDLDGATVSLGALGQANGFRAVRITRQCGDDLPAVSGAAPVDMAASLPAPDLPAELPPDLPPTAPVEPDALASLGGLGDAESPAQADGLADLPDLPGGDGGLPDLPDLPGGDGGLPDLPGGDGGLPEAGTDLPDLNDLPDLGAL